MNKQNEESLATSPMLKLVFRMAIPTMAAQVVNLLYSIVDRIYIGHIPDIGTKALAGVGITNSIIILIAAFSLIVGGGAAPLASIALGKSKREHAEKILGNGFFLLIMFSIILTGITFVFGKKFLMLMGATNDVLGYAMDYLMVYITGTFFVLVTTGLNTFINAQGRPGIGMASVLIGAVLNIILDPIFIFVMNLGVKGAAIATVISQLVSCMWVLGFLFSDKATLRIKIKTIKPERKILGNIIALGISPFVMGSTESIVGFVMNSSLAAFGDIYISALTVMQSMVQMVSVPLTGFIQGVAPIISYNFGKGNKKRVKAAFKICLITMVSVMLAAILLMIVFAGNIAGIFTDSVKLVRLVQKVSVAFMGGMCIFGLQRTCQNTFIALGESKISLFIAFLRKIILLVPLVLILPHFLGAAGVYWSESIADFSAAIICTVIFAIKFPKILQK